ncbi:Kunitz-type U15-theraphotoxin-Hs1g [Taenia crassiceps]|uniref:Kunitz-type U15-theraphotoxin-Hs1g n=1 Tax=Taenia crassiceps TaxID=6207 RepID=A0ABR4QBW3_9CEST
MTITALLTLLLLCVAYASQGEEDICSLPIETGLCLAHFEKWGFDSTKGRCVRFTYGGCGGNRNRFDTRKECRKACPCLLYNSSNPNGAAVEPGGVDPTSSRWQLSTAGGSLKYQLL